ncbi:hypothetical protein FSP39_017754 [Pinctada imbricata]|uniref:Uncharacterized protein n=1 Tax=Pinctada imbricata TaxID=66713 RepID=A0AA88XW52_PINIB|nr:hypothetical protein FSP39_017754 [Pinctada imbricata]
MEIPETVRYNPGYSAKAKIAFGTEYGGNIKSLHVRSEKIYVGDRLHNVEVKLGLTRAHFTEFCGLYEGPAKDGQVVYIGCQTGSSGQFVRVQIVGKDGLADNVLTMCELEVHVKR